MGDFGQLHLEDSHQLLVVDEFWLPEVPNCCSDWFIGLLPVERKLLGENCMRSGSCSIDRGVHPRIQARSIFVFAPKEAPKEVPIRTSGRSHGEHPGIGIPLTFSAPSRAEAV